MGSAGAAAAVLDTHLGFMAAKEIAWRKMVLLASGLWFCITASLAFFIRLLVRRVFRPRREESGSVSARPPVPISEAAKLVEEEEEEEEGGGEEKETSVFRFRFSFQIPEQSINSSRGVQGNSAEKDGEPSMVTSISNYQFSYDGYCRGLMEVPQAMTLHVQESYVDSEGIVWNTAQELDRELKTRFSAAMYPQQRDADSRAAEEFDRGNKGSLLSVKSPRWRCDLDAGDAIPAEAQEPMTLSLDNLSRAHVSEELELPDASLPDEAESPTGARLSPVPAEDFGGFDLESELESSRSDGYSVKDLSLDFDSDGCFSERDFEAGSEEEASLLDSCGETEEYVVQFDQESSAAQLPNSLASGANSEHFDGGNMELLENMECSTEIQLGNLANTIGPSDHEDNVSGGDLYAAEPQSEQFNQEEVDRKQGISDPNYTAEQSRINSYVGLDMKHMLKAKSESIVSEALEESESSESRGMEGTQLLNSYALGKESIDAGNNNRNRNSSLSDQLLPEEEPATSNSKYVDGKETGDVADAELCGTTHSEDDAALSGEYSDGVEQKLEDPLDSEEAHLDEKSKELSMEDMEELESLWEHEDLVDQLKMELKKARAATGLPTILEESESLSSAAEGLKPWKLEARFPKEDPMDELHKFFKSYRERMKKFDVLNHQKMYAIGFLQLKDPLQSMGTQKPIIPTIGTVLSQNFWLCRRRKSSSDPSEKFIKELQNDLEMIYVGQSCLSWEFLRWQYERTRELWESDSHENHQYNQVAGEFQKFQVLIQRFLENEPFQGPRVPNYVKTRCILRSLLQVPVIREDCFKDKVEERGKRKDTITSEELEYIMEDSIRIFWDFVRSDKDKTPLIMKGLFGTPIELQDPADREFMEDIQANLKQKQKKLEDVIRTGNCLVKKFKKPRQGRSNQDDLFFSQVDLKLVSRVLKMTRITTDQLAWCHKKLGRITFVDRKLLREPSFLLFPC